MLFAIMCLALQIPLIATEYVERPLLRGVVKFLASAMFLGQAAVWGPSAWTWAALVLSAAGDMFLLSSEKSWFRAGLIAFLLAHVAYVVAFFDRGISWPIFGMCVPAMAISAWAISRWLGDRPGKLLFAVRAYMTVISFMVACAFASANGNWILPLAAVLFYASDLAVARQRFIQPEPLNRLIGLPPYYLAQILFATYL